MSTELQSSAPLSLDGESQQDELWLISYADLLTLLLGFFVLLIAASPLKLSRFERIAASISGSEPPPLVDLKEKLDEMLDQSQLTDRVKTREDAEGLGIELKDVLLFDSGSAEIREQGREVLSKVAALLSELPSRAVTIEGHTDEVPIRTSRFRSNWELSAQRAIEVLSMLESQGVARERMSIRGYADTRRVQGQGELEQLRAASRRVIIRVE